VDFLKAPLKNIIFSGTLQSATKNHIFSCTLQSVTKILFLATVCKVPLKIESQLYTSTTVLAYKLPIRSTHLHHHSKISKLSTIFHRRIIKTPSQELVSEHIFHVINTA
jgi:hypothetical protein